MLPLVKIQEYYQSKEISDNLALNLHIAIDKAYIRVFEDFFISKKLHSAFDKPRLWCDKVQGTISKEEDVYKSLLGIGPQKEYTFNDAMKFIEKEKL